MFNPRFSLDHRLRYDMHPFISFRITKDRISRKLFASEEVPLISLSETIFSKHDFGPLGFGKNIKSVFQYSRSPSSRMNDNCWIGLSQSMNTIDFVSFARGPNTTSGFQQEDEGPFWHVRCNKKLKPRILNLLGFFKILTQTILDSVKKMKCGKLNHMSEYINFMY